MDNHEKKMNLKKELEKKIKNTPLENNEEYELMELISDYKQLLKINIKDEILLDNIKLLGEYLNQKKC